MQYWYIKTFLCFCFYSCSLFHPFRLSPSLDILVVSSLLPLQTMLLWIEMHIDHLTCEIPFRETFHFEIKNPILVFIFSIYIR